MATTLILSELRKRSGRIETFVNKLVERTPFELSGNRKFTGISLLVYDISKKKLLHSFVPRKKGDKESKEALAFLHNKAKSSDKIFISDGKKEVGIGELKKNSEFGGKGEGASVIKESQAISEISEAIAESIAEFGGPIPIKIGNEVYRNITGVRKTPGTPKSDFELFDASGESVIWISHKDGKGPRDFQQWGGISQKVEPTIAGHPETRGFIDQLNKVYPKGLPPADAVYHRIKDNDLKMLSVYGNQYGKNLGPQNVTVLLQGPVGLKKSGRYYILTANHVHFNGESVDSDGFEPVIMAVYKGDRSDAGIKGTRITIMPIGGRKAVEI